MTALLISNLKTNQLEPMDQSGGNKPHHALLEDAPAVPSDLQVFDPLDVLNKLPGITTKSGPNLANAASNLREVSQMSKADLQDVLGKDAGAKLYSFLNDSLFPEEFRKRK